MATKVIGVRQLRGELAPLLAQLSDLDEVIVTQRGEGRAALVDLERYDQLRDRVEYLEDSLDALEGEREGAVAIDDLT
jgi:prevent-host-death family protein